MLEDAAWDSWKPQTRATVGERHAGKGTACTKVQGQDRPGPILVMCHSKSCISKTQILSRHSSSENCQASNSSPLPTEKCPKSLADMQGPSRLGQLTCSIYFYYSAHLNQPAAPATSLLTLFPLLRYAFSLLCSMTFYLFFKVHLYVTSSLGIQTKSNVSFFTIILHFHGSFLCALMLKILYD